jgi:DNA-binding beta-propeller fold protein YncE
MWRLAIALVVVACIAGGGLAVLGSNSLPAEVQAFTPLADAPLNLSVDAPRHLIVTSYGRGYLPHTSRVVVIDARSGKVLHNLDVGTHAAQWLAVDFRTQRALAFSSDGGPAIDRTPHRIDLSTGRIQQASTLPLDPMAVAVDAENGYAVVSGSLARGAHLR